MRAQLALSLALWLVVLPAHAQIADKPGARAFETRVVKDALGRDVRYYIIRPKKATAPILLMLQGSGCLPVMLNPEASSSSLYNLMQYASEGEFTVMAVEKPHASIDVKSARQGCSPAFHEDFSAERWLLALQAGLNDARKSPYVDARRTLVFGHSEGAVMASLLAARDAKVSDVVFIGGSGTTQLYDMVVNAYQKCFDVSICIADVDDKLKAIQAAPDSPSLFAWGHPHKRWTSFFGIDPAQELLRSAARIYIAFGTADDAVPALSQELAVAKLRVARRELTVRRVPNGDHSLRQVQAGEPTTIDREYRAALDWFWQRR